MATRHEHNTTHFMLHLGDKLRRWNERDFHLIRSVGDPTVFASEITRGLKQGMLNVMHLSYAITIGLLSWSAMRRQCQMYEHMFFW